MNMESKNKQKQVDMNLSYVFVTHNNMRRLSEVLVLQKLANRVIKAKESAANDGGCLTLD